MENINIELTKKGHPAIWEKGGGMSNTGYATIIAGINGEKITPAYVNRRGHLAIGKHALFIIHPGYYVVLADHHRGDFEIEVYRITSIDKKEQLANLELVCEYSMGEWDIEPPEFLKPAIKAAKEKAKCYHCRSPHYVNIPE